MAKAATLLDHGRRIERVVAHIGANLGRDDLDLEALAGVACLSPHHFHRVYRYLTGETAAETLRRLRLHRAAAELLRTRAPVATIARRAGYGSASALTRAFAAAYGVPPAAYRRGDRAPYPGRSDHAAEETSMYEVTVRELPPVRLAALRHVGPYTEIGPVFDRLHAWAVPRGPFRPPTRMIGVFHDDPGTVPAGRLRSDAGIEIGPDVGLPEEGGGPRPLLVSGGRHAVVVHRGPYAEIEGAYRWLLGAWLPGSGEEAADRPCYEDYLNDPRATAPADLLTAVHLPLA